MRLTEIIYFGFELDLLEAHLALHKDFADHTIVVECPHTTTGIPKPCLFNDHKSRFSQFNVEHVLLPASTFPIKTETFNEFKKQDANWKHLMQPYASLQGANWILHNDTDEIIDGIWQGRFRWEVERSDEGIKTFNYHLDQRSPYVNVGNGVFHVHRMHRAGKDFIYPKSAPRQTFPNKVINGFSDGANPIGYHFTNCFSTPEELYWKAKVRNWLVQDVSLNLCERALKRGLYNIPEPEFAPIRALIPPEKGPRVYPPPRMNRNFPMDLS